MAEVEQAAHAVLLPVAGRLDVEPWLRDLLSRGTRSVLIGETRDEYVARAMAAERRVRESAQDVTRFVTAVEEIVGGAAVLVAVDQEPWGIARLHDLVAPFPDRARLPELSSEEIEDAAFEVAAGARRLGVNMFLSPVLDVLSGENPWLAGRTLSLSHGQVGRVGAAFIAGVQRAGVIAVAKHFPGHPELDLDPALHDTALRKEYSVDVATQPFSRAVAAGVAGIMTGPVVVEPVDADQPASTSAKTVRILRGDLAFQGLVVSDDLDTPSTSHGRSLLDTALASLSAGVDLLLVPGGPELAELAAGIAARARGDEQFAARLHEAAQRVSRTAGLPERGSARWQMS